MSVTLTIMEDPADASTWEGVEVESISEYLFERFKGEWPHHARLYHAAFALDHDVTPRNAKAWEDIERLDGPFFLTVYPGDLVMVGLALLAVVAGVALALAFQPAIPSLRNQRSQSPNNALSGRTNQARPNGRIPDIFGTVRSTPDLISLPYTRFENGIETEYADMCIGRGEYEIDASKVRDGETPISDIAGAGVEIYGPNTSANRASYTPQVQIGTAINKPIYITQKSNAVNGQVLPPPNAASILGDGDLRFEYPNIIRVSPLSSLQLDAEFSANDEVQISNASTGQTGTSLASVTVDASVKFTTTGTVVFETATDADDFTTNRTIQISNALFTYTPTSGDTVTLNLDGVYTVTANSSGTLTLASPETVNPDWSRIEDGYTADETYFRVVRAFQSAVTNQIDLSGRYTILSVTSDVITLSNPSAVNADWDDLDDAGPSPYGSPTLSTIGDRWIGPFQVYLDETDTWLSNFVALQGLFKDNGENQTAVSVTCQAEITPINAAGTATGSAETFNITLKGSSESRASVGVTLEAKPTFTGFGSIRLRRVTETDRDFEGTVVDEVKWRDLFVQAPVKDEDFGNVTTLQSRTIATSGALSIKDRKLNLEVTRKIPTRTSGTTFGSTLTATSRADEIIAALCLDPYIGRRSVDDLDLDDNNSDSIYTAIAAVEDYFGTSDAVEFNYTFDDDNLSLEETLATVAQAVFCQPYRRGNKLKLTQDLATDDSVLMFNHANKLPASEERNDRFGMADDVDGIEFEYVSPDDDTVATLIIPEDGSATQPRKVEGVGVRNDFQAHALAWRAYNKNLHKNGSTTFTATQEAELLVRSNRILVADNTRSLAQEGYVVSQSGLVLTLSHDVTFEYGRSYTIFLQHTDATVEGIPVTEGPASKQVTLSRAPKQALSLDPNNYALTTYILTDDQDAGSDAYQVEMVEPGEQLDAKVEATLYSPLFYSQDGLRLWLRDGLKDYSAAGLSIVTAGNATTANDADRGTVISLPDAGSYIEPVVASRTAKYTKAFWLKTSYDGAAELFSRDPSSNLDSLAIRAGGDLIFRHDDVLILADAVILSNAWVHVAATFDSSAPTGQKVGLYIDGTLVLAGDADAPNAAGNLALGKSDVTGLFDDVRYYHRALSASEITALYRDTRA